MTWPWRRTVSVRSRAAEAAAQNALRAGAVFSRANDAKRFLEMVALAKNPSEAVAAIPRVEEILKADAGDVPALMVLATANEQSPTADASKAKQTYERVLNRYPDFVPAQRQLTILYAQDSTNDQKAYQIASQAREAFPNDPEVAKALGIIMYRQGDYARAAGLLKESAGKLDGDAPVMYYLGMAQYRLKENAASKKSLQHALDLNLSGDLAGEARRTLAELK